MTLPIKNSTPTPAAIRQRRRRDRKRKGVLIVSVEVGPSAIATLVKLGLLTKAEQTFAPIVRWSYGRFVNAALRLAEKNAGPWSRVT